MTIDFADEKLVAAQSGELAYDYGHYRFSFDSDEGRVNDEGK